MRVFQNLGRPNSVVPYRLGCFFDDAVHDLLGFEDQRFQALYMLAVGAPGPDARLLPGDAYAVLRGEGVTFAGGIL